MSDLDLNELFETFAAESVEDIAALEAGLLALEDAPDDRELPLDLQRHAHSLKGNAACVGLVAITDFAHAYEDVLERIAHGARAVDASLVTLLLGGIDTFRRLVDELQNGALLDADRELMAELSGAAASAAAPGGDVAPAAQTATAKPRAQSVRVPASKLNRMLDLTGEIAIARGRVRDAVASLGNDELLELERQADLLQSELQELVMRARMVPVGPLFRQYARTVRDLTVAQGKLARLITIGEDVELDTSAVERLRDPLTHMVRNAIDHGLEMPAERAAKGKPAIGRITLEAKHDAGAIIMRVSDDGAGLDRDAIRARAGSSAESDAEVFDLIFSPGFSTADVVTEISGRGVGMDVVRRSVESLRGTVGVESVAGAGTTFTIRLPLTLAVIEGFGVAVGSETYVVPMDHVVECVELPSETRAGATGVLLLRDEVVPFVRLRHHFGIGGAAPGRENVLIVQHGGAKAGLAVDALHGASQTVIKPLGDYFRDIPGVAGSSVLGNGRVALILDTPGILRSLVREVPA
jgi:two-component system chemotaxis sensor kinase CheA